MSRYTSATDADRRVMLDAIGVGSVEEMFRDIPEPVRQREPIALPDGMAEQDVYEHLRSLAARNRSCDDEVTFVGAGMYDHYVPALIDSILQRSEFLTPYTPYQPEISQGTLQAMFEFQTAISELTGLPISNASLYGGPSSGFFAAQERYLRRMPGRIAGQTVDAEGKRGFVLTLQTREQHIRREKATSNICTSQALN